MFFKSTGGNGQRKLTLVPMDMEGYNGRQLRAASNNGRNVLFIVPLQQELDTEPLPFDAAEFSKMPQVPCHICGTTIPLQLLALHADSCEPPTKKMTDVVILEDSDPSHALEEKGPDMEVPGTSSGNLLETQTNLYSTAKPTEWKKAKGPAEAIQLFCKDLRKGGQDLRPLLLTLDAEDGEEGRDSALICFYKDRYDKQQWSAPFKCRISGDAAVGVGVTRHILSSVIHKLKHGFKKNLGNAALTTLFEGEMDHRVPTLSVAILECDLFSMAGRMIGHSAIHGGPPFAGLSAAVIDALVYGTREIATTKLSLEDCVDLDHRQTIGLLLKDDLSDEDSTRIKNLCMEWYLPVLTKDTNKVLLFQQLLCHAVLGRANEQIKQLRKGLKETGIWPLLVCRPDTIPLLFPREQEVTITSKAILESIKWPYSEKRDDSDSDSDNDVPVETVSVTTGFLRTFIEQASSDHLRQLLKFWIGWEVPVGRLKLQVVKSRGMNHLPTSSTCFERLRIPNHYKTYQAFKADIMACLESVESGFGLV
uniref:HECT domain-containing protein n=1 Tax=Knipowitschia caucasica TaxID=637954 RepID=A0AAV2K1G3_KNICA